MSKVVSIEVSSDLEGGVRPGERISGSLCIQVDGPLDYVRLQLETDGEAPLVVHRVAEGLPEGRHDVPFQLAVPEGRWPAVTERLRLCAFIPGKEHDVVATTLTVNRSRMVTAADGARFEFGTTTEDESLLFVLVGGLAMMMVIGILMAFAAQSWTAVIVSFALAGLAVAGYVAWSRRHKALATSLADVELELTPTVDSKSVRAVLRLETFHGAFLESVTFRWKGANGRYVTTQTTPRTRYWQFEPFVDSPDIQRFDEALAENEEYEFESVYRVRDDVPISFTGHDERVLWSVDVVCDFRGLQPVEMTGVFEVAAESVESIELSSDDVVAQAEVALDFEGDAEEETSQTVQKGMK